MHLKSRWQQVPAKRRRALTGAAALLLAYTVGGFVVLPVVARWVAVGQLKKALHREVAVQAVRFNPYAFALTVRGLKIEDPDAQTLLAWDEVQVNFQLSSLFRRAWTFSEISVVNPYARVQVNKDRTFNFSDLLPAPAATNTTPTTPAAPAKPLALHIGRLNVEGARLAFADLTPRQPFRRVIGPVKIAVTDFRTDPNNQNPHVFTGTTETGETFTWGGHFSTDPLGAAGELGVENLGLTNFAPLYEDLVNFEIRDGVAGFRVQYDFQFSAATNVAAFSNAAFTLRSFRLATPGAAEELVRIPEFAVTHVRGDLFARNLEVGAVNLRGAEFNLVRAKGADFNLATAAAPGTNASAPGGLVLLMSSVTNAFAQLLNSTNLATATVRAVAVQDCAVTLRDDAPGRPVRLRVDEINVAARNLSNRPDTNLTTEVALRWNTNGTVRTRLAAALNPLHADLELQLNRIELAPLSPYLDSALNLYVLGSKVGLDGVVRLRTEPGQLPTVTFNGTTALDDLNLVGGDSGADLLKWSALRFEGIAAVLNPPAVTVTNITLADLAAHVLIESNGVMNVTSLLRTEATNAPVVTAAPPAAAPPAHGSALKQAFAQVKTLLGMETNFAAGLPRVEIQAFTVTNAEVQFTDRSVHPPAHAVLNRVNAEIRNLSTEELRRAEVRVTALAGGTGPIELAGQLNPLRAKAATEASLSLKHVKLKPADPYAGKFLGYRLTRGELNVDVAYTVTASQVKGRNRIVLDQLTLGSRVASTNATSLPVKLGLALLKDSSGKIELDVPVEGNLDDPQFRLGKVIWGVIANVFVKAITSPFSLLGSLVGGGGGEELQFQQFAPGTDALDAAATNKLAKLAGALAARPELQVEIEGNVDPAGDGAALQLAKLDLHLRTERWNALRPSARTNLTPAQVQLAPEERAELLARAFRDALKTNASLAAALAAPTATNAPADSPALPRPRALTEKGATKLLRERGPGLVAPVTAAGTAAPGPVTETQMTRALAQLFTISDGEFAALASRRAAAVRAQLVERLNIAPDRVFQAETTAGGYATNGTRVNLQLR